AIQDKNRAWITLVACMCASGEALPPAIIYEGIARLRSSWVNDDDNVAAHEVFFSHSSS
ncbi:hypothetical protein EJ07DRAFT_119253, partial [Lizonia empirigonia]